MARAAISLLDSTAILSCFVLGAELLLLFAYVRTQILTAAREALLSLVESELYREGRYLGEAEALARPGLEALHSSFCADSYNSGSMLATLGYVLATVAMMSIVTKVRPARGGGDNVGTAVVSAAAGMVVFLLSQWGFLKLAILPFYAKLYNRVKGADIPVYEADELGVTSTLLAPTFVSVFVLVLAATAYAGTISWSVVAWSVVVACLSLGTEVVSWFLMQGFAVPVAEIVSSITDAATAVLWVNKSNPPAVAVERLREAMFPGGDPALSASNILRFVYRDNFARRRLEITPANELVVAPAESSWVRATLMLGCAACLLVVPFVVVAVRAPRLDAALLVAQLFLILLTYGMYTLYTGYTSTMTRLSSAVTSAP